MSFRTNRPIAIIGIGCRFPGGIEDARSFWDLLAAGTDAIGDIPADRWESAAYYEADPETPSRMFVRQGGFLHGRLDAFDAGFFGMTPREAAALDPQQRLLLEVAWEALEDAGHIPASLKGASVGTYIGGFTFDAAVLQLAEVNRHLVSAATPTGVSMTMLSARLAYTFDWRGPTLTMDTACSSSLVAFHHACVALSRGECDLAVAGGVNVMLNPVTSILMSKGQFLSPDARCKSFDHRANGYARAEGAGIVLLKPLDAAQRDGDRIYAVARGTAVNQDGRTPGITVPSAQAQRELILQACRSGEIDPWSIGYFEAHGTGTAVGDPIEASAIGGVLTGSSSTHWIGSVKSNFGHSEAAAGVAGVIKASLCLERGEIPANLHFERPNPAIPFDRLPLRVPTAMVPFESTAQPRRAGVNSFGFGGTNAHAVLEQAPAVAAPGPAPMADDGRPCLLPLSARSAGALRQFALAYASLLESPAAPAFRQVCQAAARHREHHALRSFVVATDAADAVARLHALEPSPRNAKATGPVVFVYTGMGPQWFGMAAELLEIPRFAEVVAACDEVLARFDICMMDEFSRPEGSSRLGRTLYAQVGNFVLQAGLTALWKDWGIEPAAIVGHSVGEVAAAYAAGVYSLEDALTISFHRARLQATTAGRGTMASVAASVDTVQPYLVNGAGVAAVNSPTSTTLAGDHAAMATAVARLREAGMAVKELRVEVAYHSHHMDEIRGPLAEALRHIRPQPPRVTLYSSATGERVEGATMDASYWWDNVRKPVLFAQAFTGLQAHLQSPGQAAGIVLEVGPHPVLATAIDEILSGRASKTVVLASQRRASPQWRGMQETLGAMYAAGLEVDWLRVYPGPRRHIDLPRYPWQREVHWSESAASLSRRLGTGGPRLGGQPVGAPMPTRDVELAPSRFSYLSDHRIGQTIIFPGAGYLEVALSMFADETPCVLENIVFARPLALQAHGITTLRCAFDPQQQLVTLHSRAQAGDESWTSHVRMRHFRFSVPQTRPTSAASLAELTASLPSQDHEAVYERLSRGGFSYGPAFRSVNRVWHAPSGEVFAEIRLDTVDLDGYRLHPALLDAALQAMVASAPQVGDGVLPTFVPARIAELRYFRSPGRTLWMRGRPHTFKSADYLECDLTLFTDDNEVVADMVGLRAQRLVSADSESTRPTQLYYETAWRPQALERTGRADGSWLVVGASAAARALAQALRERGATTLQVAPQGEWVERIKAALAGEAQVRVVYLADAVDAEGDPSAAAPVCSVIDAPLTVSRALHGTAARLFLVTMATQGVTHDSPTLDPFAASLWGLGRVINAERPELRSRLIDVDLDIASRIGAIEALVDELSHDDAEDVALVAGTRFVCRMARAPERSPVHHVDVCCDTTAVRLQADKSGLDGLGFVASARKAPGAKEVEIKVAHVGINFKDLLKVSGVLAREAMEGTYSQTTLGLECAGTVLRVGAEVTDLQVGDQVFAHSRDLFGSHVTLEAQRVAKKPAALSLAQAASLLPVATAYLSLVELARVRPGERVLIHSAAGGVGLAAVRLAKWLGAEVYATAGSEARREFLRREGVTLASDSHGIGFVEDILAHTQGQGIDVVLNSQPGEVLHKSLGLLRPFGRFIEIGKGDIVADTPLGMAPFHRSLSFHALDYDRMMLVAPERVLDCMRKVADLYDREAFAPLPVTELPAREVGEAFRTMMRREQVGKIVVRMSGEVVDVPASTLPESPVRADATYVITGGLGGLGLEVARRLAECGARRLVLVGRRGVASADAEKAVTSLRERGVRVQIEKVDVGQRAQVAAMLTRLRQDGPPLRGIVHAAADFDDVVLSATTTERLVSATRPKADGAWFLHLETRRDPLDFFVLFSSVAAQIGAAAAGAYATGNEFLNGLARWRQAHGLTCTAIGWGMIGEVGVTVSRNGMVGTVLRRNGHNPMSPARLVAELETLLRTRPAQVSVADIRWEQWARANPQLATLPRYAEVAPAGAAAGGEGSLAARLHSLDHGERTVVLTELVKPMLESITGLKREQVDEQSAVDIDSLAAVELSMLVENAFGVRIAAIQLQRNLTAGSLGELLAPKFDAAAAGASAAGVDIVAHELLSSDGLLIHGHLSLPAGPGPHPAVVVCGPGAGGALDDQGRYARVSEHAPLHQAGFAVFTVDQRGAPGHGPAYTALADMGGREIDDVVSAARYLAALPDINASRISILGTSRGGYSALLALAREPALWWRAVLIMGLYDPDHLVASERERPGMLLPKDADIGWQELETHFADPQRRPLASLAQVAAPMLLLHGEADELVPLEQATRLVAQATRLGLAAKLTAVPDLAHDTEHASEVWERLWPEIVDFLNDA